MKFFNMNQEDEIKLINSAPTLNFCTIDKEGYPSMRIMANLRDSKANPNLISFFENEVKNPYMTYMTTFISSKKVEDIKNNNKASLNFIDMSTGCSLTLYGTVVLIEDNELKKKLWNDAWVRSYKDGINDPNYGILKFNPMKVRSSSHGKSNEHLC